MRTRIIIISLIAVLSLSLAACAPALRLKSDRISMQIGDYVDVCDYVDGDFSMSVDNTDVVMQISDTVLYAQKAGSATVTVSGGVRRYEIAVSVGYVPEKLSLTCSSLPYTDVTGSVLEFTADLGANSEAQGNIMWRVNGELRGVGKDFPLTLDALGRYEVMVSYRDQSQSMTAVCFTPFSSAPHLEVAETADGYEFTAAYDSPDDFAPVVEWEVDGVRANYVGELFVMSQAGRHSVFAYVNGVRTEPREVAISGEAEVTDLEVDFDSDYPNVFLRWSGPTDAEYSVKAGGVCFGATDPRMKELSFDLTGLVGEAGGETVTLLVGGEYYEPCERTVTTPTITDKQRQFLSQKYFGGNHYMTSDGEILDIVSYYIFFREGDKVSFSVYMGYETDLSAAVLLSRAWVMTEQMGSYRLKAYGSAASGETPTFEITFLTPNEPKPSDTSGNVRYESLMAPTFGSGLTMSEYLPKGGEVVTSDQLFYMVQRGYSPVVRSGSAAERIYAEAHTVLSEILSDDMDDERKVRAVIDWVMWNTAYDYGAVSSSSTIDAVTNAAYYMEGVFDNGFAVCDGISKSVSLLCNLAGVKCLRVVGLAVRQTTARHAWNKVCLEGKWYNVDATWDDALVRMGGVTYEGATHIYYLKADCQMTEHVPNFPSLYPEAKTFFESDDDPAVFAVRDSDEAELSNAIESAAKRAKYEVRIGDNVVERNFSCLEIELSVKAKNFFALHNDRLLQTIRDVLRRNPMYTLFVDRTLLIMIGK